MGQQTSLGATKNGDIGQLQYTYEELLWKLFTMQFG